MAKDSKSILFFAMFFQEKVYNNYYLKIDFFLLLYYIASMTSGLIDQDTFLKELQKTKPTTIPPSYLFKTNPEFYNPNNRISFEALTLLQLVKKEEEVRWTPEQKQVLVKIERFCSAYLISNFNCWRLITFQTHLLAQETLKKEALHGNKALDSLTKNIKRLQEGVLILNAYFTAKKHDIELFNLGKKLFFEGGNALVQKLPKNSTNSEIVERITFLQSCLDGKLTTLPLLFLPLERIPTAPLLEQQLHLIELLQKMNSYFTQIVIRKIADLDQGVVSLKKALQTWSSPQKKDINLFVEKIERASVNKKLVYNDIDKLCSNSQLIAYKNFIIKELQKSPFTYENFDEWGNLGTQLINRLSTIHKFIPQLNDLGYLIEDFVRDCLRQRELGVELPPFHGLTLLDRYILEDYTAEVDFNTELVLVFDILVKSIMKFQLQYHDSLIAIDKLKIRHSLIETLGFYSETLIEIPELYFKFNKIIFKLRLYKEQIHRISKEKSYEFFDSINKSIADLKPLLENIKDKEIIDFILNSIVNFIGTNRHHYSHLMFLLTPKEKTPSNSTLESCKKMVCLFFQQSQKPASIQVFEKHLEKIKNSLNLDLATLAKELNSFKDFVSESKRKDFSCFEEQTQSVPNEDPFEFLEITLFSPTFLLRQWQLNQEVVEEKKETPLPYVIERPLPPLFVAKIEPKEKTVSTQTFINQILNKTIREATPLEKEYLNHITQYVLPSLLEIVDGGLFVERTNELATLLVELSLKAALARLKKEALEEKTNDQREKQKKASHELKELFQPIAPLFDKEIEIQLDRFTKIGEETETREIVEQSLNLAYLFLGSPQEKVLLIKLDSPLPPKTTPSIDVQLFMEKTVIFEQVVTEAIKKYTESNRLSFFIENGPISETFHDLDRRQYHFLDRLLTLKKAVTRLRKGIKGSHEKTPLAFIGEVLLSSASLFEESLHLLISNYYISGEGGRHKMFELHTTKTQKRPFHYVHDLEELKKVLEERFPTLFDEESKKCLQTLQKYKEQTHRYLAADQTPLGKTLQQYLQATSFDTAVSKPFHDLRKECLDQLLLQSLIFSEKVLLLLTKA